MKKETICDLCDMRKQCIKMLDHLWACVICRIKFYSDDEIKQTLNKL